MTKTAFTMSWIIHLLFITGFVVLELSHFDNSTSNQDKFLVSSVRVDIVGMPDLTVKEKRELPAPQPAPVEQPKPTPQAAPQPKPQPVPKPEVMTLSKKAKPVPIVKTDINSLRKKNLENIKRDLERKKAIEQIRSSMVKGNVVSQGNALTGEARKSMIDAYGSKIKQKVNSLWDLPVWLNADKLNAEVAIYLDAEGHLVHKEIIKSSGNNDFDKYVLHAIEKAAPFDVPPSEIITEIQREGIVFEFSK